MKTTSGSKTLLNHLKSRTTLLRSISSDDDELKIEAVLLMRSPVDLKEDGKLEKGTNVKKKHDVKIKGIRLNAVPDWNQGIK